MPVQYTSILAEHRHTRTIASIFDCSHMGQFRCRVVQPVLYGSCSRQFRRSSQPDSAPATRCGLKWAIRCTDTK
ncbi:MAG: hypothetical protein ACKJSG_16435 [Lentisphaeria bacterium]